jgi:hypothetical protein
VSACDSPTLHVAILTHRETEMLFQTADDEREYRKLSKTSRTLALIAAHRINLQDRIEMMKEVCAPRSVYARP